MSQPEPLSAFVRALREALDRKDYAELRRLIQAGATGRREARDWAKQAAGDRDEE